LTEIEQLILQSSHDGIALWKGVDAVIRLFSPIMSVLRKADSEQPCMGIVYDQMSTLLDNVSSLPLHTNRLECEKRRADVRRLVAARWEFLHQPVHSAAYAMNPAFLSRPMPDEVIDDLDSVLLQLCGAGTTITQLKKEWEEFREYNGPGSDEVENESPHEWWYAHGRKWPNLKLIAMRILAQCPSSSPSERNWSAYDFVHSKIRNRLTQARAEKLVYIFHNLRTLKHLSVAEEEKLNRLEAEASRAMQLFADGSDGECCTDDEGDD
jgi:hAT family C-terminal dimerisation region